MLHLRTAMRLFRALGISALSIAIGCSEPTNASVASLASGSWVRVEHFPGNTFEMNLAADGSSLSGTGSFQGEAGLGGTLTVEGEVTNGIGSLDFTMYSVLTEGTLVRTAHFTGRPSLLELRGSMESGDNPTSLGSDSTVFIHRK
jgi:hypothetical protein